ncbi:MAG: choice-of-anchor B family protein [Bacteroidota bacterium]
MRLSARVVLFLVLIGYSAVSQQNLNMEYLGNKNDHALTGQYSACWGYVAPDGREYAILGCQTGTSIIDITDAPTLREVSFIPGPTSNWREMKTYKQYAYVVTENGTGASAGIQIIDLTNLPTSATLAKTYVWTDTVNSVPTSFPRVHSISVNGNHLYLNGGNYNGIRILDVRDPLNPVKAGVYAGPYIHDSHIRNDTIFASAINPGGGLDIVDVRNKSNPTRIKLLQYPDHGTHNAWTTQDRNFVVTTDEIGKTPKTLKIWDIRNIENPTKVAEVAATFGTDTARVHNVFIKGNLAFVAWYQAGIRVVDLTNPISPQVVGYYDTYPQGNGIAYAGAWGADPYFPSGKVIVSDMQTGLHVVRYTGDKRGIVNGTVTNGSTGAVIVDVLLHFKDAAITRWTGSNGQYIFGYAPGTYSATVEAPGFQPKEVTVTVTEGATTTTNITLSPVVSVEGEGVPTLFSLDQNYPNPFNPSTTIRFTLPGEEFVSLKVMNILGQDIALLVNGRRPAGAQSVTFDARDLPSGVYLYRLVAGNFSEMKRMIVLK